jgi:hypothetical protein
MVDIPVLGEVHIRDLGLPLFSIVLGLVDGFNPCAMWVLLFLLSLLVNLHSRRRMAAIGGTFVLVSGGRSCPHMDCRGGSTSCSRWPR